MTNGTLIGNIVGTAIVLKATEKYIMKPLKKKKKTKHKDIFNLDY